MRAWIIGLIAGLIVLAVGVPLALTCYLVYTEPGLALLAQWMPHRFAGTELTVRGVRGSVAHGLHIDHLQIRQRRVRLDFDDVDLQLDLSRTLLQTLYARRLEIGDLRIEVLRRTTPYVPAPLYFLPHWLNVRIDALHIAHGSLVLPSGRRLEAAQLRTHGTVSARTVRFYDATMRAGDMGFASRQGVLRGTMTLAVAADLALDYHPPGAVGWRAQLQGNGDLNALPFSGRISAPFEATIDARALDLTRHWNFDGRLDVTRIALDTWGGSSRLGTARGELAVQLDERGFTAGGRVTPQALGAGAFDVHLGGAYAHRVLAVREFSATHEASGSHITAQGSIDVGHGSPQLDLTGGWTHLGWPLVRTAAVRSEAGAYAISGTWPFDVSGHGDLAVGTVPAFDFAFTAALYPEQIRFNSATLSGRGGTGGQVNFKAEAHWAPNPLWSAGGTATDLNPAVYAATSPGRVSFGFQASGEGFRAADPFSVQVQNLSGVVHNLPARGSGHVSRAGALWRLDGIRALVAGTSIALDGTLSERADLKFNLRSPDLSLLLPGLHGHVDGNGEIHGALKDPSVQATVSAGALQFERVALSDLAARVDIDPQRNGPSHVDVHARGLALGTRTIDDLRLKLDGEERNHDLDLAFVARDFNVRAHGSAGFDNGAWHALLRQMTIIGGDALNLDLAEPAGLTIAKPQVHVDDLCLKGSPARLCAGGDWTEAKWSLHATAAELPMQTLTAGQSSDLDYRGQIDLALKLFGSGGGPVEGSLAARLSGAQLRHRLAGGKIEVTTLGAGDVQVTATPATVTAQLGLDAGPQGSIKGQLTAQRAGGGWRDMPVNGSVMLQTQQLEFIPLYVPEVDRAAGHLAADLEVAGSIGAPLLTGTLSLTQGELDLYEINLAMREATLKATLQSNRLDFDGAARFGAGHAAARGALEWRNGAPFGDFTLSGSQLRVADVPEAQIDASPDLKFHIGDGAIAVTGVVNIPRARIVPADLTHAVLASSDAVIVGATNPTPVSRYEVISDVTLALGEDVTIEAMGLKARLNGSITEHVASNDQVTHATGDFNVAQGDYTAYGRKLEIERGRLIFSGGPVGDPGIDVRAVKRFDDPTAGATLAGVNVRGTLRQPQLSFFSEPPLPQQQIVSLLLAGGGLVGGQSAAVTGINASRGATNNELLGQGAAIIGQQLGSRIGITDVGVESNIYNETSLVLGRYLSPRLYVSYGLGLTQTLNTVKLRYTLGDHWTVRTEFGQIGGADLVYTLDK